MRRVERREARLRAVATLCLGAIGFVVGLTLPRTAAAAGVLATIVLVAVLAFAVGGTRRRPTPNPSVPTMFALLRSRMKPLPLTDETAPFHSGVSVRGGPKPLRPREDARVAPQRQAEDDPGSAAPYGTNRRSFGDAALGVLLGDH
jgi:hypothetical protein